MSMVKKHIERRPENGWPVVVKIAHNLDTRDVVVGMFTDDGIQSMGLLNNIPVMDGTIIEHTSRNLVTIENIPNTVARIVIMG